MAPTRSAPARWSAPRTASPRPRTPTTCSKSSARGGPRSPSCSTSTASVAGLITLEDLLEELVGAIDDEHDVPSQPDPLVSLGGTRYEVDATVDLEQLNERLTLRLPTDGDFLTVGGLAFHALGRVPEPGVKFQFAGVEFTVVEVVDHSIRRVRLDLQPRETVGSP